MLSECPWNSSKRKIKNFKAQILLQALWRLRAFSPYFLVLKHVLDKGGAGFSYHQLNLKRFLLCGFLAPEISCSICLANLFFNANVNYNLAQVELSSVTN